MPIRLNGSTSGYSQLDAPAVAGDQLFTLPGTGGTLDRLNRAGNVLQVVNATYSISSSTSTNVFSDTGLTATITPTSATSKVLVLVNHTGIFKTTNNTFMRLRLLRGATILSYIESAGGYNNTASIQNIGSCSTCYLDSPATTAATVYKTQFNSNNNVADIILNQSDGTSPSTSTITLMEIAA